jgi:Tfp pilus assembly protein PilP
MKRTTGILVCTLAAGMAWAQSPEIIPNTRAKMDTVQQNKTAASNEALGIKQPAAKDSHAKPAAAPVKSSAAVLKTSAAPAKASVAPIKTNSAPAKSSTASAKASTASAKVSVAPVKVNVAPTKASAAPAKANVSSTKPKVVAASPASKSAVPFAPKKAASASPAPKVTVKQIAVKKEAKPAAAHKTVAAAPKTKNSPPAAASSTTSDSASAGQDEKASDDDAVKQAQDKKWSMSGKRDPFISPVVSHTGGSGCSTGKKCLEIGAINLRGVVHSDAGFIAVVTNSLNKAYFLRENDPVFDGYVVKITGDSVIFKETMQDRLGKSFTREVVKKLTTPAV